MAFSRIVKNSAVRYVLAGGLAFVFNVVLLNVFQVGLKWPTSVAAMLAFWGTFGFCYAMQRIFAFQSKSPVAGSLVRYSILVAFNSIVVSVVVTLCNEGLGIGLGTSQLIATVLTTAWNYFAYKHWVYAGTSRATAAGNGGQDAVPDGHAETKRS